MYTYLQIRPHASRAKKGRGSWNWRFKFPVLLPCKNPRLHFQFWDKDIAKSVNVLHCAFGYPRDFVSGSCRVLPCVDKLLCGAGWLHYPPADRYSDCLGETVVKLDKFLKRARNEKVGDATARAVLSPWHTRDRSRRIREGHTYGHSRHICTESPEAPSVALGESPCVRLNHLGTEALAVLESSCSTSCVVADVHMPSPPPRLSARRAEALQHRDGRREPRPSQGALQVRIQAPRDPQGGICVRGRSDWRGCVTAFSVSLIRRSHTP